MCRKNDFRDQFRNHCDQDCDLVVFFAIICRPNYGVRAFCFLLESSAYSHDCPEGKKKQTCALE